MTVLRYYVCRRCGKLGGTLIKLPRARGYIHFWGTRCWLETVPWWKRLWYWLGRKIKRGK